MNNFYNTRTIHYLNLVLKDEAIEKICTFALENRDMVSPDLSKRLNAAIRKSIRISGFRPNKTHLAAIPILSKEISSIIRRNPALLDIVISIWVEANSEFSADVNAFLENHQIVYNFDYELTKLPFSFWEINDLQRINTNFTQENNEYDPDDSILMLCWQAERVPLLIEDISEIQQEISKNNREQIKGLLFDEWLSIINELTPDAKEWKYIDEFVSELYRLKDNKLKESEIDLTILIDALESLTSMAAQMLDYFNLSTTVKQWNANNCDPSIIEQLTENVTELQDKLITYQSLNESNSKNLSQEKEKRSNLELLESEAFALYNKLMKIFLPDTIEQDQESTDSQNDTNDDIKINPAADQYPDIKSSEIENQIDLDEPNEPNQEDNITAAVQPPDIISSEKGSQSELDKAAETSDENIQTINSEEEIADLETTQIDETKTEVISMVRKEKAPTIPDSKSENDTNTTSKLDTSSESVRSKTTETSDKESSTEDETITFSQLEETILKGDEINSNDFLWFLISKSDLAGAYWLSESICAQGNESAVPPWLLKALQGSFWLSPNSERFVNDLLDIVNTNPPPQKDDNFQQILGLSTAILPSLIAPYTGLLGWLETPACCYELRGIVEAIKKFASLQIALQPEDVLGVSGADKRKRNLENSIQTAKTWLEEAPNRRTKFKRASDVWRALVGPKGELRQLVEHAAADKRKDLVSVKNQLEFWQDRDKVSATIDNIDKEIYKLRATQIIGIPREQLFRNIAEACEIVQQWYKLASHEQSLEDRGDWIGDQISELKNKIVTSIPSISESIENLTRESQPISIRASAKILKHAIISLVDFLKIQDDYFISQPKEMDKWDWLAINSGNLENVLNRRLLFLPTLELTDLGSPVDNQKKIISEVLRDSLKSDLTVKQIIREWINQQDFRFIPMIMSALPKNVDEIKLQNEYLEALQGSREALKKQIDEMRKIIEQAVINGILGEGERSEKIAIIESIEPSEIVNIRKTFKALEEIKDSINELLTHRLSDLKNTWDESQKKLLTSNLESHTKKRISDVIGEAFDKKDTRLVEEYIASLSNILDKEGNIDASWLLAPSKTDHFIDFYEKIEKIEYWLESRSNHLSKIAEEIMQGKRNIDFSFKEISTKRREEAKNAINSWRFVKQQRGYNEDHLDRISTVMQYLGFTFTDQNPINQFTIERDGPDWLYLQAKMSAGGFAKPIPQFGSLTLGKYHIICLWERPGADMISARLRDLRLKLDSVILLYFGRLTNQQRNDLIRMSSDEELILAVLDEVLLVFLSKERDVRLPIFFRCSIPFAALNPYTPFQAGDVPPEMFYGREEMARELQRPQGSSIVFGGRQLGKSALLRHVEREFHNPDRNHYAKVIDIKLLGDPTGGQNTDLIWRKVRDAFIDFGLISSRTLTDKPDEIEKKIRQALKEDDQRRVLLLFDEADNFLDADAKDNFLITERFRVIMLDSQRRLKVVFAGLHNVQRFQGIANQPLAHFGNPLCVGPLEPNAAYQLVNEPLMYLGFRFIDNSDLLRILSFTNYHPGLIQLFCQKLIHRMRTYNMNPSIPFMISQDDIEGTYGDINAQIRERFDWTLALDLRYQAIAWSLIVDQIEARDSYARAYPPGKIIDLVRYWWEKGFGNTSLEELRSLLDEMVGLGVLIRGFNGQYRLRSPNLVRLMGTQIDIETQLEELSDKSPPPPFEPDHHHALLDEQAHEYCPFTHEQERSLNKKNYGVSLIFGSEALGMKFFHKSIERFVPFEGSPPKGSFILIPLNYYTSDLVYNFLDKHMREYSELDHVIASYDLFTASADEITSVIEGALEYCKRHQSKRKVLRVILIFDPESTWLWHSLADNVRISIENSCDAVVSPNNWDKIGIRQRLKQHGKFDSENICKEVLQATGGWPLLLDELFNRLGTEDDPRPVANNIISDLKDANSDLFKKFFNASGLVINESITHILTYLISLDELTIPLELITPEFIAEYVDSDKTYDQSSINLSLMYMDRLRLIKHKGSEITVDNVIKRVLLSNE